VTARERPEVAAHRYAAHGWPVFPCRFDSKEPATEHGFKDATTDPEKVDWLWRRDPALNVGIATGAPGPDVVDVDNHGEHSNGFGAWAEAKRAGLVDNPLAIISTPSGGIHAYFAGTEQGNGRIRERDLDFRSKGGYVVAPPSAVGGRPYAVVSHQAQGGTVSWGAIRDLVGPAPQPRRQADAPQGSPEGTIDRLAGWLERRPPGDRNFPLFWAAKQAASQGLLDSGARDRLLEASLQSGIRGGEQEALRTIDSGARSAAQPAGRPFARQPASPHELPRAPGARVKEDDMFGKAPREVAAAPEGDAARSALAEAQEMNHPADRGAAVASAGQRMTAVREREADREAGA